VRVHVSKRFVPSFEVSERGCVSAPCVCGIPTKPRGAYATPLARKQNHTVELKETFLIASPNVRGNRIEQQFVFKFAVV
jgi:hypothetical protein